MTKVTHNLGFKVLALFLAVISGVLSFISVTAVFVGGESGFYSGDARSYYETPWCEWITDQYADQAMDMYNYRPPQLEEWSGKENVNFGYEILTLDGEKIAEGNVPQAVGQSESYSFYTYGEYNGDGEWIDYDEPVNVSLRAYVKAPLTASDDYWLSYRLYEFIYSFRMLILVVALASILTFFAILIYLLCAAGHRGKSEEIIPNLQDRIPLEIYFGLILALISIPAMGTNAMYPYDSFSDFVFLFAGLVYFVVLAIAVMMTTATRLKMGKWWRNSITYWVFRIGWKFMGAVFTTIRDTITALPMTWKYAVAWFLISLFYFANSNNNGTVFIVNCIILVLVLSVANQLQKLKKAGEQLANGNLDYKVDTSRMFRSFRRHGSNLNSLSKGATIAMEQKMKSERLKTELITNVSHDIKTPLTSIINYVDLLKKEELTGKAQGYLEVLDRQSRRLKKLTEDLVEASKASTGNISAHLAPTDLCELVHQAVAEYEEKLEKAKLEVIITTQEPVFGMVDGNLTWRVLSNLLSNACKYSQTGTRVYISISKKGNSAIISMKNTSREQLNIAPDELMERFVRGDSSRSTEGSGLGLNIARSLVELQKGKFTLSIEGDLFKAFVQYPSAKEPAPQVQEEEETSEAAGAKTEQLEENKEEKNK
ncbi:HAMP domain-containing sensor histidine kinase [Anaerotignum sp.]|uniref:HAMP domain-containing sensor histidine kinase n=1 Tax=Anaerotignum sp. TaxID=2039241 RepID=UPI0027147300|nr:histidine kinase dimerization/phospho-acceptor domain-containing protein [Anaerotignum sp.]